MTKYNNNRTNIPTETARMENRESTWVIIKPQMSPNCPPLSINPTHLEYIILVQMFAVSSLWGLGFFRFGVQNEKLRRRTQKKRERVVWEKIPLGNIWRSYGNGHLLRFHNFINLFLRDKITPEDKIKRFVLLRNRNRYLVRGRFTASLLVVML